MNDDRVKLYWQAYLATRSDPAAADETYLVDSFGDDLDLLQG